MASSSGTVADTAQPRLAPDARAGLIGTALLDARGGWEVVDGELCELLCRPEPELLALHVASVLYPDDLARERGRLEQLAGEGLLNYRSEARLLRGDGHVIWALLDAAAIVDASGAARCL